MADESKIQDTEAEEIEPEADDDENDVELHGKKDLGGGGVVTLPVQPTDPV